jgi:hypothetical protein
MKLKFLITVLFFAVLLQENRSFAQTQVPYQVPANYRFDYEVEQVFVSKKASADTSVMHFFYTRSGDYAAVRISTKRDMKGNLLIVLTRDGMGVIFDERNRNITVINIRKLLSGFSDMAKWIRMDSVIAHMRKKMEGRDFQSVKTGKSKQLGSYTSEEYALSDSKGPRGSVWLTKVDFNTQADYILGIAGGNLLKMMSGKMAAHPLLQAMVQPKTLVSEIDMKDSADGHGVNMHTVGINPVTESVSTTGYGVSNYSDMSLPEIFQAEMKKRNK